MNRSVDDFAFHVARNLSRPLSLQLVDGLRCLDGAKVWNGHVMIVVGGEMVAFYRMRLVETIADVDRVGFASGEWRYAVRDLTTGLGSVP